MNIFNKLKQLHKFILIAFSLLALFGLYWLLSEVVFNKSNTETQLNAIEDHSFSLSLDQNDVVRGSKLILGTGADAQTRMSLFIDGTKVQTEPVMKQEAWLTLEVTNVESGDGYVNSIWVNEVQVYKFTKNIIEFTKISLPISDTILKLGINKVSFRSGKKLLSDDGDYDDWQFRAVKFELADGTILVDPAYKTASTYSVGDGLGLGVGVGNADSPKNLQIEHNYEIQENKFRSIYYVWDTLGLGDGSHEVEFVAENLLEKQKKIKKIQVQIDNSPPTLEIISPLDGKQYKNKIRFDVKSTDAISGNGSIIAKLDSKVIELPSELEANQLVIGRHKLEVTTTDKAGNKKEAAVFFYVLDEMPAQPSNPSPVDSTVTGSTLPLQISVQVSDPTDDPLNVTFYKAKRYNYSQVGKHDAYSHAVDREPPLVLEPEKEITLSTPQRLLISNQDGRYLVNDSKVRFPYHRFSIEVGEDTLVDAEIVWVGHSLVDRLVTMYGWNYEKTQWEDLASNKGSQDFTLRGKVNRTQMIRNGKVQILVQDRIPTSGEYDFAFLWMTDTQYYAESYPHIFDVMTKWAADHWKEKKFSYLIHTGDIVNTWNSKIQWERASHSMKTLDDANIPYGIVAGNHDVAYEAANYDEYWKYFGRNRFVNQPTFGGDLNNNRDHYDLISAKGNDFVIIYLGWIIEEKTFAWAKAILKKYSDRNAIIATHEYLKPSKAYFGQGESIWKQLVVPYNNVMMVLGGHNPGATYNIKQVGNRKVLEMLSDYQNEPEGGLGFMRFLQFDLTRNRMLVNTYSPYLNKWNFYPKDQDEFEVALSLKPINKQVATDYIGVHSRTNELIGQVEKVPSGSSVAVSYPNLQSGQTYSWYVVAQDEFGGKSNSEVWSFKAE